MNTISAIALLALLTLPVSSARRPVSPPRYEEFPAKAALTVSLSPPQVFTFLQKTHEKEIRNGVEKGFGVFSEGVERRGVNFAGNMIVIQWGCGAPCSRMALVIAETGEVFCPPISIDGIGRQSFDLPLLTIKSSYPQNPEVEFKLNSKLMIIKASDRAAGNHVYSYYFTWQQNRWLLVRRIAVQEGQ